MALSGLLVLVQNVGMLSLSEGGSIILFFVSCFFSAIMVGFGSYREEYEHSTGTDAKYANINTAFENKSWLLLPEKIDLVNRGVSESRPARKKPMPPLLSGNGYHPHKLWCRGYFNIGVSIV